MLRSHAGISLHVSGALTQLHLSLYGASCLSDRQMCLNSSLSLIVPSTEASAVSASVLPPQLLPDRRPRGLQRFGNRAQRRLTQRAAQIGARLQRTRHRQPTWTPQD